MIIIIIIHCDLFSSCSDTRLYHCYAAAVHARRAGGEGEPQPVCVEPALRRRRGDATAQDLPAGGALQRAVHTHQAAGPYHRHTGNAG